MTESPFRLAKTVSVNDLRSTVCFCAVSFTDCCNQTGPHLLTGYQTCFVRVRTEEEIHITEEKKNDKKYRVSIKFG